MVVRVNDQKNIWGKTLEPNRSDLWQVDFSQVTAGLQTDNFPVHYYATGVVLPRLSVKPQEVKEGGVPILYPSWDEPLSEIKVDFVHDIGSGEGGVHSSRVYKLLEEWRKRVRSGRPGGYHLDNNFKFNFAFDVVVKLLKGNGDVLAALQAGEGADIEVSETYVLKNAWLGGFQISDLNYDKTGVVTINSCLYASGVVSGSMDYNQAVSDYSRLIN